MSKSLRFFSSYDTAAPFYRDLLPYLADLDMKIEVIISDAEYRTGRMRLETIFNKYPNIKITYIPAGGIQPSREMQKAWIVSSYIVGAIFRSLFSPPVNINLFITQPIPLSIYGYILKVVRHQSYYCLIMDVYPDLAVKSGYLKKTALVTRFLQWLSRNAVRNADAVIVIGRCMYELWIREGIPQNKLHLIRNWVNEIQIVPVAPEANTLRIGSGLQDDFIVLYSGNMGITHTFEDILEVARRCRGISKLKFVFIGDGIRRKEIDAFKKDNHLDNIILLPYQPPNRLSESLSLGDVHFVSLRDGFEGLVVPSKAYGPLAVGRAIIYQGSPYGEIARMVNENQVGFVIQNGRPDLLEKAVMTYYHNSVLLQEHGMRALSIARNQYSYKRAMEDYKNLFLWTVE